MSWGRVSRLSASGRTGCTSLVVPPRDCLPSSPSVPAFATKWIPQGKSEKGLSPNRGMLGRRTISLTRAEDCSSMGLKN